LLLLPFKKNFQNKTDTQQNLTILYPQFMKTLGK